MKFIKTFWPENRFVLGVFVVWRFGLFIIESVGNYLVPFNPGFPYWQDVLVQTKMPQWLWQWGNFDGTHYLTIAKVGYDGFGDQVFFPLYPMLMRGIGDLVGQNYFMVGLIISNLAILIAGMVLFRLVKTQTSINVARWAVIFLFAFPTSFYFGSIYTESLFLCLVLLAFFIRGIGGMIAGVLAGATRLVGIFSSPLAFIGVAAYSFYLLVRFQNPLFFLSAQSAFGNSRASSLLTLITPPQTIFRYLKIFITVNPRQFDFWLAGLEFAAFWLGLSVLSYLTWRRKLPAGWLIFGWLAFLLPTFSGTFSSMPRYLLAIFPIPVGLAMIKSSVVKYLILTIFICLLAILVVLFTRGTFVA